MNAKQRSLLAVIAGLAMAMIGSLTGAVQAETTLITLGTAGGPVPRPDRAQPSNLLIVNGTLYLVDAGGSVTGRVVQSGNNFRKVSKIFITHAHSDHTSGLATLLVSQWEQQAEPADIYGSGVAALVKGAIDYLTPNAEIRWAEGKKRPMTETFRAHDVEPGVVYQDANVKVTAVENTHFHFPPGTPPYGKYKSYSYRFETPDRVVFFTGDTGPSDEQAGFLRHMHEEHVTPEDIGKMAAKAGVKAVVMTHLGPSINPDEEYQRYVDEAKKYYSGPITLAKDLMKF